MSNVKETNVDFLDDNKAENINQLACELQNVFRLRGITPEGKVELTGTGTSSGTDIVGTGTAFSTELKIGQLILNRDLTSPEPRRIVSIADDENLVVDSAFTDEFAGANLDYYNTVQFIEAIEGSLNYFPDGYIKGAVIEEFIDNTMLMEEGKARSSDNSTDIDITNIIESDVVVDSDLRTSDIPTMTSNILPSGYIASGTTEVAGFEAYKGFAGVEQWWSANATTGTLTLELPSAKTYTWYAVGSRDYVGLEDTAPATWTLQGWDSSWNTIDTQTSITDWTQGEVKYLEMDTSGSYTKYQIVITLNNGDVNFVQCNLKFYESEPKDLIEADYDYKGTDKTQTITTEAFVAGSGEVGKYKGISQLVPTMTSNVLPSGVVSASSEFSATYAAWHAFDGLDGTVGSNVWITTGTSDWLKYQFTSSKIINYYVVQGGYNLGRSPKDWTFEGSNNGVDWTTLDTITSETSWTSNERRGFTITNTTAYTYYRINITSNNGGSYIEISKLEMYGISETIQPSETQTLFQIVNPSDDSDTDLLLTNDNGLANIDDVLTSISKTGWTTNILATYSTNASTEISLTKNYSYAGLLEPSLSASTDYYVFMGRKTGETEDQYYIEDSITPSGYDYYRLCDYTQTDVSADLLPKTSYGEFNDLKQIYHTRVTNYSATGTIDTTFQSITPNDIDCDDIISMIAGGGSNNGNSGNFSITGETEYYNGIYEDGGFGVTPQIEIKAKTDGAFQIINTDRQFYVYSNGSRLRR